MEGKRLLTKENKKIMHGGEIPKRSGHRPRGLVVESAEGVRFAYTTLPLPREALPEIVPVAEAVAKEE